MNEEQDRSTPSLLIFTCNAPHLKKEQQQQQENLYDDF